MIMSISRREFLKVIPATTSWFAFPIVLHEHTPSTPADWIFLDEHRHELVYGEMIDVVRLRKADVHEIPPGGGAVLAFARYDRSPQTVRSISIPQSELLYVRGATPFGLRIDVSGPCASLSVAIVLANRTRVQLYREIYEGGVAADGLRVAYSQLLIAIGA
jgi:hypothetical protein